MLDLLLGFPCSAWACGFGPNILMLGMGPIPAVAPPGHPPRHCPAWESTIPLPCSSPPCCSALTLWPDIPMLGEFSMLGVLPKLGEERSGEGASTDVGGEEVVDDRGVVVEA
ncbi:hypothetical protein Drorol1_Dr00007575 [Drosera rotundifolia]